MQICRKDIRSSSLTDRDRSRLWHFTGRPKFRGDNEFLEHRGNSPPSFLRAEGYYRKKKPRSTSTTIMITTVPSIPYPALFFSVSGVLISDVISRKRRNRLYQTGVFSARNCIFCTRLNYCEIGLLAESQLFPRFSLATSHL
jgi:hypothetical protein